MAIARGAPSAEVTNLAMKALSAASIVRRSAKSPEAVEWALLDAGKHS